MKNRLLALFCLCLSLQACDAQTPKNPKYLGIGFGNFDVDQVSFKENVDTLFSKSKESFKRTEKDGATPIGYQYFLNNKLNKGLKVYFMDQQLNDLKTQFITDKNNSFSAVKLSMNSAKPIDILSKINQKYGKYAVKLKTKNALHNYQWDTPQKYISLAFSDQLGDEGYMYYVVIVAKKAADNKFPINWFSNPITVCLDKSCKE